MNSGKGILALVLVGALAFVGSASLFVVQEAQLALLLRLGEIVDADFKPGLHFKMPVIQDVVKFDKRIQALDSDSERFLTIEKKFVVVNSFVKWRISDVAQFYRSTRGSQIRHRDCCRRGSMPRCVTSSASAPFRRWSPASAPRSWRPWQRTPTSRQQTWVSRSSMCVSSRSTLPTISARTSTSVCAPSASGWLPSCARRVPRRPKGSRPMPIGSASKSLRTPTVRPNCCAVRVMPSAAETYAKAFEQNAEFYSFWRSLTAYRDVFSDGGSMMVLDPDSEFFRYFKAEGE